MKIKQLVRCRMDMDRRGFRASAALMGAAFFIQAVYYFGFADLRQLGIGVILVQMVLPMLLEAAWFILLRQVRLNAPGVYGILGACLYLLIMVQTAMAGSLIAAIVGLITLLPAAIGLFAVIGGYVCSRIWAVGGGILALIGRVLFGGLPVFLPEVAALCGIVAVLFLLDAVEMIEK